MLNDSQDNKIILLAYKVGRIMTSNPGYHQGDPLELTMLQLRTLTMLSDTHLTMTKIAKELHIKLPTASLLIGRLYDAALVSRVADKNDRRRVNIKITSKGKNALAKTMESRMKRMRYLLKEISKKDKDSLFEILNRVYLKINKEEK